MALTTFDFLNNVSKAAWLFYGHELMIVIVSFKLPLCVIYDLRTITVLYWKFIVNWVFLLQGYHYQVPVCRCNTDTDKS